MIPVFSQTGELYVPEKVTVGRFSYPGRKNCHDKWDKTFYTSAISDTAVVTCRFKNGGWMLSGVFERLTGYKPTNQADREAQFEKTVTNAVEEIDNEPVSGFRLEKWDENLYSYRSKGYDAVGDVVIRDPRGFAFPVSVQSFFEIVKSCGGNVRDWKFEGKFVYAWAEDTREMTLKKVEGDAGYSAMTRKKKAPPKRGLKDSDLVPGRAYRAFRILKGDYVFVGRRDTYSGFCHMAALRDGRYDAAGFEADEKWCLRPSGSSFFPTTTRKMVFFKINPEEGEDPYVVRTSASNVFERETEISAHAVMYSDLTKPVTYENVLADMERNIAFSRINVHVPMGFETVSEELFEEMFVESRQRDFAPSYAAKDLVPKVSGQTRKIVKFPFPNRDWPKLFSVNGSWCKVADRRHLSSYGYSSRRRPSNWRVWNMDEIMKLSQQAYVGQASAEYRDLTHREFVEKFSPSLPALFFENGRPVPEEQRAFLLPEDVMDAAKQVF